MKLMIPRFDRSYIFNSDQTIEITNTNRHSGLWEKIGGNTRPVSKRFDKMFCVLSDLYDDFDQPNVFRNKGSYYDMIDELYQIAQNLCEKIKIQTVIPKGTRIQFSNTAIIGEKNYLIVYLQFPNNPISYVLYIEPQYLDDIELTESLITFVDKY